MTVTDLARLLGTRRSPAGATVTVTACETELPELSVSVAVSTYWPAALKVTVVLAPLVENVGAAAPLGRVVAAQVTLRRFGHGDCETGPGTGSR